MRIAFLSPSFAGGGAQRCVVNLARGFGESGWDVDVVVVRNEGPFKPTSPEVFTVIDLACRRTGRAPRPLRAYLESARPDVIVSSQTHMNLTALRVARRLQNPIPVIAIEHNTFSIVMRSFPFWRRLVLGVMVRREYPHAARIVCVSNGVAEDFAREVPACREALRSIHNPIVDRRMIESAMEETDHPWLVGKDAPVLCAVGRFHPQKDYPTMLRALALANGTRPLRLIVVGTGEALESLRELSRELGVEERVDFVGYQNNPFPFVKNADAFVLSSAWEGFGNVLVEALALGTPVVSTDCPNGPAEILENGKWGILTPVGSVEKLAAAMLAVLESPRPIPGPEVLRRFTLEGVVAEYEAEIQEVLKPHEWSPPPLSASEKSTHSRPRHEKAVPKK